MNKQEILSVVSDWLDAICKSPSGDYALHLEKQSYLGTDGQVEAVRVLVKVDSVVGVAELPMHRVQTPGKTLVIP